jgi:cell division protein FtsI (penicillin-binding protein 3)
VRPVTTRTAKKFAAQDPERQYIAFAVCALCFFGATAAILHQLHQLQVQERHELVKRAERQREREWTIPAPRGTIVDAQGLPLAHSQPVWHLFCDPDWVHDKLYATVALAPVLGMSRDELRDVLDGSRNGVALARDLDEEACKAVQAVFASYRERHGQTLGGLYLRPAYKRTYPQGNLAPHVIGMQLADGSGGSGVEAAVNSQLSGREGRERILETARRQPMPDDRFQVVAPDPGAQVQLSIIAPIQRRLQESLLAAVAKHQPTSASGVVVNPATGAIVAMASYPDFALDDWHYSEETQDQFRNNVLNFVYESGSTMKPLIAGAAVVDGLVNWNTSIFCENGRWTARIGNSRRTINDHSFKYGGHQYLTVTEGVAKSDNILMAKLGIQLGPERLYEWVRNYGFGHRTGIDIGGEDRGVVRPREKWDVINSCMSVPMGHELSVTPLQMAMAHAAVANRGIYNPPHLVERILSVASGSELAGQKELPLPRRGQSRRVLTPEAAVGIQTAMTKTMTEGTGKRLQLDGYSSAGKTGTTEMLVDVPLANGRKVKRYSKSNHIGSFVCWAPAEPGRAVSLVALVVVEDPQKNGHYGSQTAGPVVQEVLQFGLEYLNVPPSYEVPLMADVRP